MPPNQNTGNKPNDLRQSDIKCNPDWAKDSAGRHHVFLFDGTWNDETGLNPTNYTWDSANQLWISKDDPTRSYPPITTNVVKTSNALAPDGPGQITHYFRGVGNDDENDALNQKAEGIFATMEEHVRNAAYCEFLKSYQQGDQISILGFSRGAASARLFARDLAVLGLAKYATVEDRYLRVRNSGMIRHDVWSLTTKWAKAPLIAGEDIPIAFLGVWDTVPKNVSAKASDWRVPDTVARAVHCLALDETRDPFTPTLLNYPKSRSKGMKEVWFPGAHSDVGGSYFHDALARVSLDFMWKNWASAFEADQQPPLQWRTELAAQYVSVQDLPWLRHQESLPMDLGGVSPRVVETWNEDTPRVHPSVENFIQHGGLQFCVEDGAFPPQCQISPEVYQPLAYPGASKVELYDSTTWD